MLHTVSRTRTITLVGLVSQKTALVERVVSFVPIAHFARVKACAVAGGMSTPTALEVVVSARLFRTV